MRAAFSLAVTGLTLLGTSLATPLRSGVDFVRFKGPFSVEANSVHNIHVECSDSTWEGDLRLVYGDCDMEEVYHRQHEVGTTYVKRQAFPDRFVWVTPSDAIHNGCLHAYSGSTLLGRSTPIAVSKPLRKRQTISEVADSEGPWFDGVSFMESKNISTTFVAEAKSKDIAIIGGGMSGAMTALLLQSVGVENWHIIESSQRIGGRIRTKYLNGSKPEDYQYQEMGPMRFPVSVKYADTNETLDIEDHKLVFQLASYVNELNGNDSALEVKFIPWIQSSPNVPANSRGYRLPNGRIPSAAQIRANSSLANPAPQYIDEDAAEAAEEAFEEFLNVTADKLRAAGRNVYRAHKEAIENGLFQWSEAAYLKYELGLDANLTDFLAGSSFSPLWGEIYDSNYFAATTWRTIDKGLSSLPRAITPLVQDKTTFGRKVVGLTWNDETNKVGVKWREDPFAQLPEVEEYDYAVVAVPFSKVRLWRNPTYSSLLSRAINTLNYQQSCKVALHYKTRFWEHLSPPIIGGCGSTDIPGMLPVWPCFLHTLTIF
jgi:monoamine oxidase